MTVVTLIHDPPITIEPQQKQWLKELLFGGCRSVECNHNTVDIYPDIVLIIGATPERSPIWNHLSKLLLDGHCFIVWLEHPDNSTKTRKELELMTTMDMNTYKYSEPMWMRELHQRCCGASATTLSLSKGLIHDLLSIDQQVEKGALHRFHQLLEKQSSDVVPCAWVRGILQPSLQQVKLESKLQVHIKQRNQRWIAKECRLMRQFGMVDAAEQRLLTCELLPPGIDLVEKARTIKRKQQQPLLDVFGELIDGWFLKFQQQGAQQAILTAHVVLTNLLKSGEILDDLHWLNRASRVFSCAFQSSTAPLSVLPLRIINLDRRPDHWFTLSSMMQQHPQLFNVMKRVPAVDGFKLRSGEIPWPEQFKRAQGLPPGSVGCTLSHLLCWDELISSSSDGDEESWMLIGEDDVTLGPMFLRDYGMVLQLLPYLKGRYGVIWLGYHLQPAQRGNALTQLGPKVFTTVDKNHVQKGIGGSFLYLISSSQAKAFKKSYLEEKELCKGIDVWMMDHSPERQLTFTVPTAFSAFFIHNVYEDSDCAN